VIEHSDVMQALALYHACDGKPGVAFFDTHSSHAADAFSVIQSAQLARQKEQDIRAESQARHDDAKRSLR
jgi:hypothetical protein